VVADGVSAGQILMKDCREEGAKVSTVLSVLSFSEWSPHP